VANQTNASFYPSIKSERVLLDSTVNVVFQQQDATKTLVTRTANYYDNPRHYQVTRSSTLDSKGDTLVTRIKYPQDYIPSGDSVTYNTILDSMIGRNMVSETIEKQDSLYYPGSSAGYVTGAQLSLFRILSGNNNTIVPDRTYKLGVNSPVTNFQPFAISGNTTSQDSRYRQMISFDQYDANNNLQQYTPIDQNSMTFLWDYTHVYPIAQVKNAVLADVAATSFEADGTGNWTYAGTSTFDTTSITGTYCYNLGQTSGNITKSGLTSATTYVLSYWIKNSSSPLTITGTQSGYPIKGKTINNWTYFEHQFTGQTSITVSGTAFIDELRLYPASAQMTTFTYSPLAGTTTTCDADNKVTYYFYDAYQRLKRIRDQDGNILKTIQYHYANQNPSNQ
jgi:YD repeat-containing protein